MARSWQEILELPQFQALDARKQEALRNDYFRHVIAPEVGIDDLDAARATFDQETAPRSERTWGEALSDTGVQLAEGGLNVLGAPVSLLAPESDLAESLGGAGDWLRKQQSLVLRKKQAAADAAVEAAGADGFWSQLGEGLSQYSDPALAGRLATTNLLSMVPGLAAGRLAQVGSLARSARAAGVAPGALNTLDHAAQVAAAQRAMGAAGLAGGGVNAVLNAGGARQEAYDDLYQTLIDQGVDPAQAREQAVSGSVPSAGAGGAAGFLAGRIGLEPAFAGRALGKGGWRAGGGAALAELAGEQGEELIPQATTNLMAGQYDQRPWTENLGQTAAQTLIGTAPGAGVAGLAAGLESRGALGRAAAAGQAAEEAGVPTVPGPDPAAQAAAAQQAAAEQQRVVQAESKARADADKARRAALAADLKAQREALDLAAKAAKLGVPVPGMTGGQPDDPAADDAWAAQMAGQEEDPAPTAAEYLRQQLGGAGVPGARPPGQTVTEAASFPAVEPVRGTPGAPKPEDDVWATEPLHDNPIEMPGGMKDADGVERSPGTYHSIVIPSKDGAWWLNVDVDPDGEAFNQEVWPAPRAPTEEVKPAEAAPVETAPPVEKVPPVAAPGAAAQMLQETLGVAAPGSVVAPEGETAAPTSGAAPVVPVVKKAEKPTKPADQAPQEDNGAGEWWDTLRAMDRAKRVPGVPSWQKYDQLLPETRQAVATQFETAMQERLAARAKQPKQVTGAGISSLPALRERYRRLQDKIETINRSRAEGLDEAKTLESQDPTQAEAVDRVFAKAIEKGLGDIDGTIMRGQIAAVQAGMQPSQALGESLKKRYIQALKEAWLDAPYTTLEESQRKWALHEQYFKLTGRELKHESWVGAHREQDAVMEQIQDVLAEKYQMERRRAAGQKAPVKPPVAKAEIDPGYEDYDRVRNPERITRIGTLTTPEEFAAVRAEEDADPGRSIAGQKKLRVAIERRQAALLDEAARQETAQRYERGEFVDYPEGGLFDTRRWAEKKVNELQGNDPQHEYLPAGQPNGQLGIKRRKQPVADTVPVTSTTEEKANGQDAMQGQGAGQDALAQPSAEVAGGEEPPAQAGGEVTETSPAMARLRAHYETMRHLEGKSRLIHARAQQGKAVSQELEQRGYAVETSPSMVGNHPSKDFFTTVGPFKVQAKQYTDMGRRGRVAIRDTRQPLARDGGPAPVVIDDPVFEGAHGLALLAVGIERAEAMVKGEGRVKARPVTETEAVQSEPVTDTSIAQDTAQDSTVEPEAGEATAKQVEVVQPEPVAEFSPEATVEAESNQNQAPDEAQEAQADAEAAQRVLQENERRLRAAETAIKQAALADREVTRAALTVARGDEGMRSTLQLVLRRAIATAIAAEITRVVKEEPDTTAVSAQLETLGTLGGSDTDGKSLNPEVFTEEALAAWEKLALRDARRLVKEERQAEHVEVIAAALAGAWRDSEFWQPEADSQQQALEREFVAGWGHALDGKTGSTLPPGASRSETALRRQGYDAAVAWLGTEDGKAFVTGAKVRKMAGVGEQLGRQQDERKQRLAALDLTQDDQSGAFVVALFAETERSDLFPVLTLEGLSPGARRYLLDFRGRILPFKEWMSQMGHGGRGKYTLTPTEALTRAAQRSQEEREWLRGAATYYIEQVSALGEVFAGVKTVAAAAEAVTKWARKDGQAVASDGRRFLPSEEVSEALKTALGYGAGAKIAVRAQQLPSLLRGSGGITGNAMWSLLSFMGQGVRVQLHSRKEDQADDTTRNQPLKRPRFDRVERESAVDDRQGRAISAEELTATFGLKGVTYGKGVTAKQRTDHTNYAYDAFMDLARTLGIRPQDIGMGGALTFAFGALGHGRHAAHYTPDNHGQGQAINLTNTRGDGAVAHEWFHALDWNLRASLGGGVADQAPALKDLVALLSYSIPDSTAIEAGVDRFLKGGSKWSGGMGRGATPQDHAARYLERTIRDFNNIIRQGVSRDEWAGATLTQYKKAADALGAEYWGNPAELLARAGEAWVYDRLEGSNNYLVSDWVEALRTMPPTYRGQPYPSGEERLIFNDAFDRLLKEIEWTDRGPVLKGAWDSPLKEKAREGITRAEALLDELTGRVDRLREEAAAAQRAEEQRSAAEKARREAEDAARLRAEWEALQAQQTPTPSPAADGKLSLDELEALFDEAAAEVEESQQEPARGPEEVRGETPDTATGPAFVDDPNARVIALGERLAAWDWTQHLTWRELGKIADEVFGGTKAEGKYSPKDAYDALEMALNRVILAKSPLVMPRGGSQWANNDTQWAVRRTVTSATVARALEGLEYLNRLDAKLPTQTNRTAEQDELQQFSTPHAHAALMARVANLRPDDVLLEPSAGSGNLVAMPALLGVTQIHVNELAPRRASILKALGFTGVTRENAEQLHNILGPQGLKPTVIIMNPPFSASAGRVAGARDNRIGAQHVEAALKLLAPGGRAVLLMGKGYTRGHARLKQHWTWLLKNYRVRANLGLDGAEYKKFGTSFDNRLVVIDKTGPTTDPDAILTGEGLTVAQAFERLETIRNERVHVGDESRGGQVAEAGSLPRAALPAAPAASGPVGDEQPGAVGTLEGGPGGDGAAPPVSGAGGGQESRAGGRKPGAGRGAGRRPATGTAGTDPGRRGEPAAGEPLLQGGAADAGLTAEGAATLAHAAAEFAKHGVEGINEALTGLAKLFGGPSRLRSFPGGIDEETYAQAKPHFERAAAAFLAAGNDFKAFFKTLIGAFGAGIKPYALRFAEEWQARPTDAAVDAAPNEPVEAAVEPAGAERVLGDSIYEGYQPQPRWAEQGARPHPGALVESAAMAAVAAPPLTVSLDLPREVYTEGRLSAAQLDAVAYTEQAHQRFLPNGERQGFFIGDGCVAGETRIYNPDTGSHDAIADLAAAGKPIRVLALTPEGFRAVDATSPFKKGVDDLYRVNLSSGRSILVTDRHKFLTPGGWMRIVDGLGVGHFLASVVGPAANNLGFDPSIRDADVRRWSEKPQDCLDRYLPGCHPYDAQPPWPGADGQGRLTLPADVPAHTLACPPRDGRVTSPECNHPHQPTDRPSKNSYGPLATRAPASIADQAVASDVLVSATTRPSGGPSLAETSRPLREDGVVPQYPKERAGDLSPSWSASEHPDFATGALPLVGLPPAVEPALLLDNPPDNPQLPDRTDPWEWIDESFSSVDDSRWDRITSLVFERRDVYFDVWVPGPQNYVAEGLVNHNTGVGKGREVAGILFQNWRQGRRKAVWLSVNNDLYKDSQDYLQAVTGSELGLFNVGRVKADSQIEAKEGVAFMTYPMLRGGGKGLKDATGKRITEGKKRIDQLIAWLGEDFEGVIAFDESHNMGNALPTRTSRGANKPSQVALLGVELQRRLPKARVVYVSATGATEPNNLGYLTRLGLWGEATPFADVGAFVASVASSGLAAMEVVAKDMKALGVYLARSLPYHEVSYAQLEHRLTEDQREMYDTIAHAWQVVLGDVNSALDVTNQDRNGEARGAALAQFWGAQQRFFNQILTALQMPSLITSIEADLEAGRAPILQFVNTNEASQERAANKLAAEGRDLEELDITPRQVLMQFLQNSFPVTQYEQYTDDDGNTKTRPVTDAQGNPVESLEAVALRDGLLDRLAQLRFPDNPIDIVVGHFGSAAVAEITGRKRRFVRDAKTGAVTEEKRNDALRAREVAEFQGDRRRVLIFSDKGGTGKSYHADLTVKNQRKRVHYVVQPGWRADKAIQGLGRSHRTNQASAPHVVLVMTNLRGHRRFVASIARRMDQLGALTKGQRKTGGQGLFTEEMNLESEFAAAALETLIGDVMAGRVEGVDRATLTDAMGLQIEQKVGRQARLSGVPTIQQFLNRILVLEADRQNQVFDAFSERLEAQIEHARDNGTLDMGLENVRADQVRKQSEREVYVHPRTGATTRLVELDLVDPIDHWTFDGFMEAMLGRGHTPFFARNKRSKRVWAFTPGPDRTDRRTGQVAKTWRVWGTVAGRSTTEVLGEVYGPERHAALNRNPDHKWEYLDLATARQAWADQYAVAPKTETKRIHLLSGVLLPIWDRLSDAGQVRVQRALTDEGEMVLGRLLAPAKVDAVLLRLTGSTRTADMTPASIFDAILNQRATAVLANNWRLTPRRIANNPRIELAGNISFGDGQLLREQGVIFERIGYEGRYFIPTERDVGVAVLERVLENRPVIEMTGDEEASGTGPRFSQGQGVTGGISATDAKARLSDLLGAKTARLLVDAGLVTLVNRGAAFGGVTYADGRMELNLDALDAGTFDGVALHEGFHATVRDLLGGEVYRELMQRLEKLLASRGTWVAQARAVVPKGTAAANVTEEVGAYAVEQVINGGPVAGLLRSWAESLLSALRAAIIRRLPNGRLKNWALANLQARDLARLAVAGLRAKARGRMQGAMAGGQLGLAGAMYSSSEVGDSQPGKSMGERPGLFDLPPIEAVEITGNEFGENLTLRELQKQADKLLQEIVKSKDYPLKNDDTGWELLVNSRSRKKMGDNPKLSEQSSQSVYGLVDLVKRAVVAETHPDIKHDNPRVNAIHRLYAPVIIAGKPYRVKLTVKDYFEEFGRRNLHAIEALEIENAPMGTVLARPDTTESSRLRRTQPTSGRTFNLDQLLAGVKHDGDDRFFGEVAKEDGSAFDPANPDIRYSTVSPVTGAEAPIGRTKAMMTALKQAWSDRWTQGLPVTLGSLTLRQLAQVGADWVPLLAAYDRLRSRMDTRRNVMTEEAGKLGDAVDTWSRRNAAMARETFELMGDSSAAGVDPSDFQPLMVPINLGPRSDPNLLKNWPATEASVQELRRRFRAWKESKDVRERETAQYYRAAAKIVQRAARVEQKRQRDSGPLIARWQALSDGAQHLGPNGQAFATEDDARQALGKRRLAKGVVAIVEPIEGGWAIQELGGKQVYTRFRDLYQQRSREMLAALIARINSLESLGDEDKRALAARIRAEFESPVDAKGNPRIGPYFPFQRFGKWYAFGRLAPEGELRTWTRDDGQPFASPESAWSALRTRQDLDGVNAQPVKREDGAGWELQEVGEEGFWLFESVAERREAVAALKAEGWDITGQGLTAEAHRELEGVSEGFVADAIQKLKDQGSTDEADTLYQLYLQTLQQMSIRKHFLHRKGTKGYTADQLRAFGYNMTRLANQISKLEMMPRLEKTLRQMEEGVKESRADKPDGDVSKENALLGEVKKRHEFIANPTNAPWTNVVSALNFFFYLGVTPAAALVNMSQTPIVGLPVLAARSRVWARMGGQAEGAGGWGAASKALTQAAGDVARGFKPGVIKSFLTGRPLPSAAANLTAEERAAFDQWDESGARDRTQAHNLAGIGDTDSWMNGPTFNRVMAAVSGLFHAAEVFNRDATLLAGYRLARASGLGHDEAIRQSEEVTWDAHFDYCVPMDTECLTTAGWKLPDDIKVGDIAIAVDADGLAVESPITEVNRFLGKRKVTEFSHPTNRLSFAATDNHEHLVRAHDSRKKQYGRIRKVMTKDLKGSTFLLRSPLGTAIARQDRYGVDFAALLGWIAAEGWYSKFRGCKHKSDVRLEQSLDHNPRHVDQIRGLLLRLGGEYKEYPSKQGRHILWVLSGDLRKRVLKAMPDNLLTFDMVATMSPDEMKAVIAAFADGDGHRQRGSLIIGQVDRSIQNLHVLQAMATICGSRATIGESDNYHRVTLIINDSEGRSGRHSQICQMQRQEMMVDGVWCPTTENGTWIARRNGAVVVTGNSNQNRARYMQSDVAKVLLQFKNYAQHVLFFLGRNLFLWAKGESPEVRREARTKFAGMVGMTAVFAGTAGLPLGGAFFLANVINAIFGDDDEPWDAETEWQRLLERTFPATVAGVIERGAVNRLTGLDMSSRVSIAELLWRSPDRDLDGAGLYQHVIEQLLGPTGGLLARPFTLGDNLAEGQWTRAAEGISPKFLKDAIQAGRFASEGVMSRKGDEILPREELSSWELLWKALGMQPDQLQDTYERNASVKLYEKRIVDRRRVLLTGAALAMIHQDREMLAAARAKIAQFNRTHPEYKIAESSIRRSVKSREQMRERARHGVIVNPKLGYLYEQAGGYEGERAE